MSVTAAATAAAQILSNTLAVLKTVREQAKLSKDAELKTHISELYDSVLSLKEAVMMVTDENGQLRSRIVELERPPDKPEIKQVGSTNYYFVGERGPYCQPCYDVNGKLIPLARRIVMLVASAGSARSAIRCSSKTTKPAKSESNPTVGGNGPKFGA